MSSLGMPDILGPYGLLANYKEFFVFFISSPQVDTPGVLAEIPLV